MRSDCGTPAAALHVVVVGVAVVSASVQDSGGPPDRNNSVSGFINHIIMKRKAATVRQALQMKNKVVWCHWCVSEATSWKPAFPGRQFTRYGCKSTSGTTTATEGAVR